MKYLLSSLLLLSALPAQDLGLDASGGGIGKTLRYKVSSGKSSQSFLFASSTKRATTPLKFLDGLDPRSFGVGFDLTYAWLYGKLDAKGEFGLSVTLPNDTALVGRALLNQAMSYPGAGNRAVDGLSEVMVVPMDVAGTTFKAQTTKMTSVREFSSQIPLGNGRTLIVGGGTNVILWQNPINTTEVFDAATRSFAKGPSMAVAHSSHTQTLLNDGRYLITGGLSDKNLCTTVCEVFDPKTGKFSTVGSLAYARVFHSAVKMKDGRVLVIGGFADLGAALGTQKALESGVPQTEIFDPKTNKWTAGTSLRTGRGAPGVQDMANGKILVIGGVIKSGLEPDLSNTCEIYNTATHAVTSAASITTRTGFMATWQLPNNRVLVAGGDAGPRSSIRNYKNIATRTCMIYTASTNSWATITPLPIANSGGDAVTLKDGSIILSGGGNNTLYWPRGSTAIYKFNLASNTWTQIATLALRRNAYQLVFLQAGGMAVLGGGTYNAARATDSWEMLIR